MLDNGRFLLSYARFAVVAVVAAAVVAGIGYFPTVRLAGSQAVWEMLVACGVSCVASCVGAVPLALATATQSRKVGQAILASTALRFLSVLLLVVVLTLFGGFDRVVFVLWVAISYLLMLVVDTAYAIHWMKHPMENDS